MSDTDPARDEDPGWGRVGIRLKGHPESGWSEWLDGLTLAWQDDGTTLIEGPVIDQAAPFGTISRLRDVALPQIPVHHFDSTGTTGRTEGTSPTESNPATGSHKGSRR